MIESMSQPVFCHLHIISIEQDVAPSRRKAIVQNLHLSRCKIDRRRGIEGSIAVIVNEEMKLPWKSNEGEGRFKYLLPFYIRLCKFNFTVSEQ